ncbi:Asparagine--tRNA ligase [Bertholletia excelsa]
MASEQAVVKTRIAMSKYSKRVILKTILERSDRGSGLAGERVVIGGWVKSSKEVKNAAESPAPAPAAKDAGGEEIIRTRIPLFRSIIRVFGRGSRPVREDAGQNVPKLPPSPSTAIMVVSDGSSVASLQVLVDSSVAPPSQLMPTGTCILVEGILQQPALPGRHAIELKVEKIMHVGTVDEEKYPLSRKRLPLETLRDCSHFLPRTTTVAAITRIRDALTRGTHSFFLNNGFVYVQVPIITTTDSEGFSEKFQVATPLSREAKTIDDTRTISVETVKASIEEKNRQIDTLKRSDSNREALVAAMQDLKMTNELLANLEAREKDKTYIKAEVADLSQDFFSRPAYLTVSGCLHLESYACAMGNVYAFGPRFRAQKLESKREAAEMLMVEAEMAFSQLKDAMNCAEDFLRFLSKWALDNCSQDLQFFIKRVDNTIMDRLKSIASTSFQRITYDEAVAALKQVKDKKFEAQIESGVSITEEHKSYLAEETYKSPIIIHSYPKELAPFYVRLNDDEKTVAAFEVVVPKAGTLIRGSQNEERLSVLNSRIEEVKLPKEQYEWYLDLRRHGTVTSSGFSLGFDLLVVCASGIGDVRDVIPFPRSWGKAHH